MSTQEAPTTTRRPAPALLIGLAALVVVVATVVAMMVNASRPEEQAKRACVEARADHGTAVSVTVEPPVSDGDAWSVNGSVNGELFSCEVAEQDGEFVVVG